MRVLPLALALLIGTPALAFDIENMTDAERAAFNQAVKEYLVAHPEVLVESYATLQQQEEAAAQARADAALADNQDAIYNDGVSYVGGNPDGDVTVVEFIDYRCTYCRKAWQEVDSLVQEDGNIRFVLKEFPILGEGSVLSSRFAVAVKMLHGDAVYKQAHDALLTLRADPSAESLTRVAADLGLDPAPILAKMDSEEVTAVIVANHDLAGKLEITGTPTFVIGTQLVKGYVAQDAMEQIVADARANAG